MLVRVMTDRLCMANSWPASSGRKVSRMAQCQQQALFRYTWPGRDESFICLEHAQQLRNVAEAMGFHIQLIPLSGDEQAGVSCSQQVRDGGGGEIGGC